MATELISIPNTSIPPIPRHDKVVKFKKVRRACPYNDNLDAKGEKRGILYDYQIFIDGEFHGTWSKNGAHNRSYRLLNADDELVNTVTPGTSKISCHVTARDRGRFEFFVHKHMDLLPPKSPDEEIAARQKQREADTLAEIELRYKNRRRDALSQTMYDLLQEIYSKGAAHPEDLRKIFQIRCQIEDGDEVTHDV